tara:strand:+ start:688 stop:1035 length:348 start_codon:yes stop_codon:yes gene_type:complete
MPREFSRSDRVADFIKREIALLIQRELRDPRLKNVNVNAVSVTRDMSIAKIYVTILGANINDDSKPFIEALNGAAGFLRGQLASRSNLRTTPKLYFYFDESVVVAEHISNLIDKN